MEKDRKRVKNSSYIMYLKIFTFTEMKWRTIYIECMQTGTRQPTVWEIINSG